MNICIKNNKPVQKKLNYIIIFHNNKTINPNCYYHHHQRMLRNSIFAIFRLKYNQFELFVGDPQDNVPQGQPHKGWHKSE